MLVSGCWCWHERGHVCPWVDQSELPLPTRALAEETINRISANQIEPALSVVCASVFKVICKGGNRLIPVCRVYVANVFLCNAQDLSHESPCVASGIPVKLWYFSTLGVFIRLHSTQATNHHCALLRGATLGASGNSPADPCGLIGSYHNHQNVYHSS